MRVASHCKRAASRLDRTYGTNRTYRTKTHKSYVSPKSHSIAGPSAFEDEDDDEYEDELPLFRTSYPNPLQSAQPRRPRASRENSRYWESRRIDRVSQG
jgi:hypothetical protein